MENTDRLLQGIENLWNKYFEAKEIPLRKVINTILSEIIISIETLGNDVKDNYLVTLMEKYYEEDIQYPIQDPRLWKLCLDILKVKFEQKESKYLVWIYKSHTFNGVHDMIKMHPCEVLQLALGNDSHNNKIASLLYKEYLNTIDYAMHELPDYLVVEEHVLVDFISRALQLEHNYPHTKGLTNRYGNHLEFYSKILAELKSGENNINRITHIYPFSK